MNANREPPGPTAHRRAGCRASGVCGGSPYHGRTCAAIHTRRQRLWNGGVTRRRCGAALPGGSVPGQRLTQCPVVPPTAWRGPVGVRRNDVEEPVVVEYKGGAAAGVPVGAVPLLQAVPRGELPRRAYRPSATSGRAVHATDGGTGRRCPAQRASGVIGFDLRPGVYAPAGSRDHPGCARGVCRCRLCNEHRGHEGRQSRRGGPSDSSTPHLVPHFVAARGCGSFFIPGCLTRGRL